MNIKVSSSMKTIQLSPKTSVYDLLTHWPQAIPSFLKRNMSCPGCSMSPFETLEDASRIYQVDLCQLMNEISEAILNAENRTGNEPIIEIVQSPTQEQEPTMATSYTYFPEIAKSIETIPTDSIVSRTIFKDEQMKSIVFAFAPGQELSEHTASVPAIIHILEGDCELTLGGDRFDAAAGAWARMPANMPHSIVARTPVKMLLLMIS